MKPPWSVRLVRFSPVVFFLAAAMLYVLHVQGAGGYMLFNVVPMLVAALLAAIALVKGGWRWLGAGWRWPLAALGFAIPAVGLSLYLHYGYSVDRDWMATGTAEPEALFRYLPLYTMFAGGIGFAIGWIIGRNL